MAFSSVLFPTRKPDSTLEYQQAPAYFHDLNLDQIVDAITAGRAEYGLKPHYFTPVRDEDTILYRQEIMRDLECEAALEYVKQFATRVFSVWKRLDAIRGRLSMPNGYGNDYLEKGRFLDLADTYCSTVDDLAGQIATFPFDSRGMSAFRDFFLEYFKSTTFARLREDVKRLRTLLANVKYCMLIKDNGIKVRKYENEIDHAEEIEKIFLKFRQGTVRDYRQELREHPHAEHVENGVLNLVARLYPEVFSNLDDFCRVHWDFVDATILTFSREVQFYVAFVEYMGQFKRIGLSFCYPQVGRRDKSVHSNDGYDLALAQKLLRLGQPVVTNDYCLEGRERVIVVTGPNQGGKTTFARMFGQMHHLASVGCPVAGSDARLFLFDRLFTHFERAEDINNLCGKLEDDLLRMHDILGQATAGSIIIINEMLASTSLKDAVSIGTKIMTRVAELDALCVCVTFLDELANHSDKTVSKVSMVTPLDPVRRTFKILRSPADGLAYAVHIAEKYRLTYACLKDRIRE